MPRLITEVKQHFALIQPGWVEKAKVSITCCAQVEVKHKPGLITEAKHHYAYTELGLGDQ